MSPKVGVKHSNYVLCHFGFVMFACVSKRKITKTKNDKWGKNRIQKIKTYTFFFPFPFFSFYNPTHNFVHSVFKLKLKYYWYANILPKLSKLTCFMKYIFSTCIKEKQYYTKILHKLVVSLISQLNFGEYITQMIPRKVIHMNKLMAHFV